MPPPNTTHTLALVYLAGCAVVLLWNVAHAGRAIQLQRGSTALRWLTGLAGLLVLPGVAVALTSASATQGRATSVVAWLWPATTALFLLHSVRALVERVTRPLLAIPVALFNLTVCASALVQFANATGATLPSEAGALGLAQASALGYLLGRAALVSPWALAVPVLVPLVPARSRVGRASAVALGLFCLTGCVLFAAEYPPSVQALDSFASFPADRLQERPAGDFAIGVRLLPELTRTPSPAALRNDLALVDTLGAKIIEVAVTPSGTRGSALDSLGRALETLRRDSVPIVLALGYDRDDVRRARESPAAFARARLDAVDRAVRRLRPDVFLPARDPGQFAAAVGRDLSFAWWTSYLSAAAVRTRELRPRTLVGVSIAAYSTFDSLLFAWANREASSMDLTGFTMRPSFGGGASLAARMRVAGQWARGASRPIWVFGVGVNPRLFGEMNQGYAIWGVLAWATTQPRIQGVVVDGAGDYDALLGMRAPDGRLRSAVATIGQARRSLAEASSATQ